MRSLSCLIPVATVFEALSGRLEIFFARSILPLWTLKKSPANFAGIRPTKKSSFGGHCADGVLPDSSSAASMPLEVTCSIFTVLTHSSQWNWMDFNTVCPKEFNVTHHGKDFLRNRALKHCVFGITNGGRIAKDAC